MTEKTIYPSAWPWRLTEMGAGGASLLSSDGEQVFDLQLACKRFLETRFEGFNETDRRNLQLIKCAPQLFNRLEEGTQFLENMLDFYGHRLRANAASRDWVTHARGKITMDRWLLDHARQPYRLLPPFDGPEIPF